MTWILIGLTESDPAAGYSSFSDGYRPDALQQVVMIEVDSRLTELETPSSIAEAVYLATNAPPIMVATSPLASAIYRAYINAPAPTRSVSVGDTVTVWGDTYECDRIGWKSLGL